MVKSKQGGREERRKDLRLAVADSLLVQFKIRKRKGILQLSPKRYASIKNISIGGLLVELPVLNPEQIEGIARGKDRLIFELSLPSIKKPFRIPAKILWFEKRDRRGKTIYLAGVTFEYIKEKDKEELLPLLLSLCLKGKANLK